MQKVKCNDCSKEFEVDVKIKKWKAEVQEVYFKCPNCNHRYISYFANKEIRKLQAKVKKIKNVKRREELMLTIDTKMKSLTREMIYRHYTSID